MEVDQKIPRIFPAEKKMSGPTKSNRGSRICFEKLYFIGDPRTNQDSTLGYMVQGLCLGFMV